MMSRGDFNKFIFKGKMIIDTLTETMMLRGDFNKFILKGKMIIDTLTETMMLRSDFNKFPDIFLYRHLKFS